LGFTKSRYAYLPVCRNPQSTFPSIPPPFPPFQPTSLVSSRPFLFFFNVNPSHYPVRALVPCHLLTSVFSWKYMKLPPLRLFFLFSSPFVERPSVFFDHSTVFFPPFLFFSSFQPTPSVYFCGFPFKPQYRDMLPGLFYWFSEWPVQGTEGLFGFFPLEKARSPLTISFF